MLGSGLDIERNHSFTKLFFTMFVIQVDLQVNSVLKVSTEHSVLN